MRPAAKVHRAETDCRRIHDPISLPDSNLRNIIEVEREVVPIIFIPGIMGSRLRNKHGNKVWDPDATTFMLGKFGLRWQKATKRKATLVGCSFDSEYLSVIENEIDHNSRFASNGDKTRADRGWGGVAWSSYGDFLIALQNRKWDPLLSLCFRMPVHAFGYNWTACNSIAGEKLAAYINNITHSYAARKYKCERVILVTHSMGGLVARAACKIHNAEKQVLGIIHGVQPSMGASAAYWRMKGGFERPHTIPELDLWQWLKNPSKMVKHKTKTLLTQGCGFRMNLEVGTGNLTTWVLGSDGEEVTSLLGNMPGGLELLPNKGFRDNAGNPRWLVMTSTDGSNLTLPKSDPYKEIYRLQDKFYRLVNPEWLGAKANATSVLREDVSPWEKYLSYVSQAERFHDSLQTPGTTDYYVHPDTYQFYSTGIASADHIVFVETSDSWSAKGKRLLDIIKSRWPPKVATSEAIGVLLRDTEWYINRGGYRDKVDGDQKPLAEHGKELPEVAYVITMQNPDGAGDGTVPESSARALDPFAAAAVKYTKKGEKIRRTFSIGDKAGVETEFVKKHVPRTRPQRPPDFDEAWFDRGHEPVYKTKSAQHITFTAIENMLRRYIAKQQGKN